MDGGPFENREARETRRCDHPDCEAPGLHRAPRDRVRLDSYYWFCKEHVREYNAAWDFCAGMDEAGIERMLRDAACWGRPTWPMGLRLGTRRAQSDVEDGFGFFDAEGGARSGDDKADFERRARRRPDEGPETQAMRILELRPPVSLTALKARYKEFAKRLHPDVNGGDPEAEERLKEINRAYAVLRRSLTAEAPTPAGG